MAEIKSITLTSQQVAALFELAARLRRFGDVVEILRDACATLGLTGAEERLGDTVATIRHSARKIESVLEAAGDGMFRAWVGELHERGLT